MNAGRKPIGQDVKDAINECLEAKWSEQKTADLLGVCKSSVNRYRLNRVNSRHLDEAEIARCVELREQGLKLPEIAKIVGVTLSQVKYRVYMIPRKKERKRIKAQPPERKHNPLAMMRGTAC